MNSDEPTTLPAVACCFLMGGVSLSEDVCRLYGFLLLVCTQLVVIGLILAQHQSVEEQLIHYCLMYSRQSNHHQELGKADFLEYKQWGLCQILVNI